MMSTYLGSDADGLDGLEFMTMAEACEVGHWQILGNMNQKTRNQELQQIIEWATPIQIRTSPPRRDWRFDWRHASMRVGSMS